MDPLNQSIQILKDIIVKYGLPTESNTSMYRGLMQDLLVDYPREFNLLKLPLEQGLVFRLMKEGQQTPFDILCNQLVTYLHTNFGIDINAATWAIEGWGQALGLYQKQPCVADFSITPVNGTAPLQVHFTNRSEGTITEYKWIFGDGETSAEVNPVHTYKNPGTYSVTLQISGDGDVTEKKLSNIIDVNPENLPSPPGTEIRTPEKIYHNKPQKPNSTAYNSEKKKIQQKNVSNPISLTTDNTTQFIIGAVLSGLLFFGLIIAAFYAGDSVEKLQNGVIKTTPIPTSSHPLTSVQNSNFFYEKNFFNSNDVVSDTFTWKMDKPSKNIIITCYPKFINEEFCSEKESQIECVKSRHFSPGSWIDFQVLNGNNKEIIHDGFGKKNGFGVFAGSDSQGNPGYEKIYKLSKTEDLIITYQGENIKITMELLNR